MRWLRLLVLCATTTLITVAPVAGVWAALAAPGAPNFYMPLSCNETWRAASYPNHPSFYPDPSPEKDSPIDLNNDKGDAWERGRPVLASADGTVSKSELTQYGNHIEIDHGSGWVTQYLHLTAREVKVGDPVKSGQRIGAVGDTGVPGAVHLHYGQVHNGVLQRVEFDNKPIEYTHFYNGIEYTSGNCHVDRVWTMDDKFNSKSAFCHNDWISYATQINNQSDYASLPLTLTYRVTDNNYMRRFTTTWDYTVPPNSPVNLYTPSKVGADWPSGTYVVTSEVHFHLDRGGDSFYGIVGANFTVNNC